MDCDRPEGARLQAYHRTEHREVILGAMRDLLKQKRLRPLGRHYLLHFVAKEFGNRGEGE
jgi:hypothetical protein